ncbi:hypothetical protein [Halomonas llamarensis]|uniref:Nucleotidyltransferase n=1 Tax=Halomonas llamarensis TaxID=2945104 RepID=A0ABT0SP49_9GAMM|nr:hypothetical protein [Halomonas llamarensis]MCL7929574.1 hypothetical protein [Halomonas llamarensis]
MSLREDSQEERLAFLARVVKKEANYLEITSVRVFGGVAPVSYEHVVEWVDDIEAAERLDAFVARFGRLQDTVGDKLLPQLLKFLGESLGPAADNLDKAEKFGWIDSADDWLLYRKLRNQMVHDYIEDLNVLADALDAGRTFTQSLIEMALRMAQEAENRLHEPHSSRS